MDNSSALRLDGEPELTVDGMEVSGAIVPYLELAISEIDWDALQIIESQDEGRLEIVDEDKLYQLLGLRDDAMEWNYAEADNQGDNEGDNDGDNAAVDEGAAVDQSDTECDTFGAAIPVDDYVPGEKVTVLRDEHKCMSSARKKTTTATSSWVASKAIPYLRKDSNMTTKELRNRLQEEHKCEISYDTVWKGRQKALKQVHGPWEDSFQLLFNWREEVMKRSPGSVIEIDLKVQDGSFYFRRFFCALRPCIDGFLEGCRPYLSIDSTALNGRWNGHLAAAIAIDGHNWMYPVAFGFIDGETEDNWTWFMSQFQKAIGHPPVLAISTYACKGLAAAVKAVFPYAEHRECFRHFMQNFIKRYGGEIFTNMYPTFRAYRSEVSQYFYNKMAEASPEAMEWIEKNHKLKWKRSSFNPAVKCDYVTNNLAEVLNNWIKDWKDLPICELADKIREKIMILWRKRRMIAQKLHGKILPAVIQQLKARTRGLGHLTVVCHAQFSTNGTRTTYML